MVDFICYVVNVFQFGDGFDNCYYQMQIVCCWLVFGDNMYVGFIDGDFYYINLMIVFYYVFCQFVVLVVYGGDSVRKLLFYYVVYGYYLSVDVFQFGVELVGNMFIKVQIVYYVFLN